MPGYRGQGIGTRLLIVLLDAASERYDAASLSVQADNPALRLYQRLGFEIVEDGGTWFTMRKQLSWDGTHAPRCVWCSADVNADCSEKAEICVNPRPMISLSHHSEASCSNLIF